MQTAREREGGANIYQVPFLGKSTKLHVSQDTSIADFDSDIQYTFLYWMENWNTEDSEWSWHASIAHIWKAGRMCYQYGLKC